MKLDPRRVKITTAPAVEPMTVTDAKLHLRIDHNTEDDLIARLIETARVQVEDVAQRSLITRTYTAYLDAWPMSREIILPFPPALAVTSIGYTDEDGGTGTVAGANYIVDVHSQPGRIRLKSTESWPSVTLREINGVSVVWTAGYGAASTNVPARYRQAMLLLLAHLYENRESVMVAQGFSVVPLPMAFYDLILTDRGGFN